MNTTDDQIETVRRLHGELLKQDYISEQEDLALTALLTELREMREMLEAANQIRSIEDRGMVVNWSLEHLDRGGRWFLYRDGNVRGKFNSALDAWAEVKKQGEGK